MCEVDELIEEYNVEDVPPEDLLVGGPLAKKWVTTFAKEPNGMEELTDWFNRYILREIYNDHDRTPPDIHLEREYQVYRNEESIQRHELAADLEGDGINFEEVADVFVSPETVHNHLWN